MKTDGKNKLQRFLMWFVNEHVLSHLLKLPLPKTIFKKSLTLRSGLKSSFNLCWTDKWKEWTDILTHIQSVYQKSMGLGLRSIIYCIYLSISIFVVYQHPPAAPSDASNQRWITASCYFYRMQFRVFLSSQNLSDGTFSRFLSHQILHVSSQSTSVAGVQCPRWNLEFIVSFKDIRIVLCAATVHCRKHCSFTNSSSDVLQQPAGTERGVTKHVCHSVSCPGAH